jgi:hypothetical protein
MSWRFRGAGDTLYIPMYEELYAVDAVDGTQRWHLAYTPEHKSFLAIGAADH